MTTSYNANEIWSYGNETAIQVAGQTYYRVNFLGSEARVTAPGLDITVDLNEEVYPTDDPERTAIILVAQLEGGAEL